MCNLLICEILKLKKSRMFTLSIIGVLSTPILMFIESLYTHYDKPQEVFTLSDIYDSSMLYIMILTNITIYITIASFLFSREYYEGTLKTIIPVPVSRKKFIIIKFCTLLLWIFILTIITWFGIFAFSSLYHILYNLKGYSIVVAFDWLLKFLLGNVLVFLTISPFAYIAIKSKGFVAPIIASAIIIMGSAALSNQDLGSLYPWTATFFLMMNRIPSNGYSSIISVILIIFVFLAGFIATIIHFQKEDI